MQSFLASGGVPFDYLKGQHDVPTAVKLASYSEYSITSHAQKPEQTASQYVPTATPAITKADAIQPERQQHTEQVALNSSAAPVLHRPAAVARMQTPVVIIHHTAQPAIKIAVVPAATPMPQPTPAPREPIAAKTEVALRAPDPVDRKQLEFGRISSIEPATDTIKSSPMTQAVVSTTTGDITAQECIILPWQLPKEPEKIVASRRPPQEVATKIIALDQKNTELAMVTPSESTQAPPPPQSNPQNIPASPPLQFTGPGNPAPVLLPSQNPADEKTPQNALSAQDKKIIDNLPPEKPKHAKPMEPIHMKHERQNALETEEEVRKHSGVGIQISVKQPKVDVNKLLDSAYDALMAGDQENAIQAYRKVLNAQPSNQLALFGLATTYHRAGMLPEARDLYSKLLTVDPYNFEGLNNYLVLLSDENPEAAIAEMAKLEKTHPGFSPIPAQLAIIYEKTGDYTKAAESMNKAINLSPENLKYRYNMAIILDKMGDWQAAAGFYQDLINAADRGEKIVANPEEIQQRLTFILSNKPEG